MVSVPFKIGISVVCTLCNNRKQPHGRSAPMDSMYCDSHSCDSYYDEPKPGCLWPDETDADFGYESCDHATRPMTQQEIDKWKEIKKRDDVY